MESLFAIAKRASLCVALVCALAAFCGARHAEARHSNGLLDLLGVNEPVVENVETQRAEPEIEEEDDANLWTPMIVAETTPALSRDLALIEAIGKEQRTAEASSLVYNGNSYAFSQDVVVRGSVRLPDFKALQFWGNGYTGSGHVKPVGWNDRRVTHNNTGVSLGMNLPLGAATITGFYNYHRDREFLGGTRVQQQDNSYGMAFYLNSGGFYVSAAGLYGLDDYTAKKSGESKKFDGTQSACLIETGYSMMRGGLFVLEPFAAYHYSNVRQEAFDPITWESPGGKKKYNSCTAMLGSRVNINLAGLDSFTYQIRTAWITELRSRSESMRTFNYGRVPGTFTPASPYYVGEGGGKDVFWAGMGLRLSLMGMLAASVDYDCIFNKRQTLHEGSFGLLFGF